MLWPFAVIWSEDATATCLGRLTARNGTGAATGRAGEGKFLKQADISAITCKVFDLDSATPDTAVATPAVTISSAILDAPDTTDVIWTVDSWGYNFIHDIANTVFTEGNRRYRVEYTVTLSAGLGSAVFHGAYEGQARAIRSS